MDVIAILLALHPKAWRAEYGAEFRALLEDTPVSVRTVLDVLLNALRQRRVAHVRGLRVTAALCSSVVVELAAVHLGITENILWPPTSLPRACALVLLVLPWLAPAIDLRDAIARRRAARTDS